MTLREAIARADGVNPNAIDEAQKAAWLSECEGTVQTEVLGVAPDEAVLVGDMITDSELADALGYDPV